ncbi:hypothetical protein J9O34_004625 [Salmonella enterica]|nr:hypothetical protein [Salmonella enterica]EHI2966539.1 hypothetical protein [Salmonella enterica]EHI3243821.1 hypothetical protein [Salmonella enterica]EHI4959471.1 hypothetical protein [Salmonella enterica]EHI5798302.1 hypothetical protein [Salmonella enterica]
MACAPGIPAKGRRDVRRNAVSQTALHVVAAGPCPLLCPVPFTCLSPCRRGHRQPQRHCCKVSDEAAFCLIQRPYISKTLLTRRISPRGSP